MGSIEQFRTIVGNVKHMSQYQGCDPDGNSIMDETVTLPTITAIGSEKIDGTNGSVCYSNPDGFWVQSRRSIITPDNDNANCALSTYSNMNIWMELIMDLANEYEINLDEKVITIYFEWCGGKIQKGSCVSGLPPMSMIFRHFKVSELNPQLDSDGEEKYAKWYETKVNAIKYGNDNNDIEKEWIDYPGVRIYNVMNFPTVQVNIDFNDTKEAYSEMIKHVEDIEHNSQISKFFNNSVTTGEGYVWTFKDIKGNIQRWKTKNKSHSKSSRKRIRKPVDSVLEKKKLDFVTDIACTEGRLNQMFMEIINSVYNGDESLISTKDIPLYLKMIVNDVIKEESDLVSEQNLIQKELNPIISRIARDYFIQTLNEGL